MTSGHGLLRWAPTGLDGTPTTSLTTVATAAPNVSYRTIKMSMWGVYFPPCLELKTCSSLRSVSPNTAWSFLAVPRGQYQTTWAFVLEQPQPDQTRLIVRCPPASAYRPYDLPELLPPAPTT